MPPPMQKPLTMAVVGKGRSCSFWNVSQPRRVNEIASSAPLKLANSWMSAPPMKLSFAERMIRPLGRAAAISSSSTDSSFSASRENVLADSPCLSKVSQTSPSASRVQRKCFAQVLASARSMVPPLQRFEQHRAAQPAADADRRQAALRVIPFQHFQQVQHDARARSAHRVAERNGAAVHVQSFLVYFAQGSIKAKLFAAVLLVLPRREAAEHLGGERLVDLPVVD